MNKKYFTLLFCILHLIIAHSALGYEIKLFSFNKQDINSTKYGTISINSDPEGADVILNGKFVGKTPYSNDKQSPGTYNLILQKELYLVYSEYINVINNGVVQKNIVLHPYFGTITINSPKALNIFIDGKKINSPISNYSLRPGKHIVEGRSEDRVLYYKEIQIIQNEHKILSLDSEIKFGQLIVLLDPFESEKALISIDSDSVGTAPGINLKLPVGKHLLEAKMPGYEIFSKDIFITDSKELVVNAKLKKQNQESTIENKLPLIVDLPKSINIESFKSSNVDSNRYEKSVQFNLSVNSIPENATVIINNDNIFYTPFAQNFHENEVLNLLIKKDGYKEISDTITMNKNHWITLELETLEFQEYVNNIISESVDAKKVEKASSGFWAPLLYVAASVGVAYLAYKYFEEDEPGSIELSW